MRIELQPDPKRIKTIYLVTCGTLTAVLTGLCVWVGWKLHVADWRLVLLGPAAGALGLLCTLPLLLMSLRAARARKWIAGDDALEIQDGPGKSRVIPWHRIERIRVEGRRIALRAQGESVIHEMAHVDKAAARKIWSHWAESSPWYSRK